MRKLFVLFLIVVFCSACNKTMIADSNSSLTTETVSSSESTSSNMDFTTAERWSEINSFHGGTVPGCRDYPSGKRHCPR